MGRSRRSLLVTVGAVLPLAAALVWLAHAPSRAGAGGDAGAGDGLREVPIRVFAWGFSPSVVRLRPGQTVRFVVESDDIKHGFAINELGVNLQLRPGEKVTSPAVAITLPEGTYAIHCSAFCGLGHPAMKARLVVGAPPPARGARAPWIASLLALAVVAGAVIVAGRRERRP